MRFSCVSHSTLTQIHAATESDCSGPSLSTTSSHAGGRGWLGRLSYSELKGSKLIPITASLPVFSCIATLGPFFAAFIAHRIEYGTWRAVRLLPASRLRCTWLLLGPSLILLSMFVVFPALISRGRPAKWHWNASALLGIWVPMFNYNLLGGPLFEEFGWRGFLQARFRAGDRTLAFGYLRRMHVGSVASFPSSRFLEQRISTLLHVHRGLPLNRDGLCVQLLRRISPSRNPDASRFQFLTTLYRQFSTLHLLASILQEKCLLVFRFNRCNYSSRDYTRSPRSD